LGRFDDRASAEQLSGLEVGALYVDEMFGFV